jgi:uncharacterized membrane protein
MNKSALKKTVIIWSIIVIMALVSMYISKTFGREALGLVLFSMLCIGAIIAAIYATYLFQCERETIRNTQGVHKKPSYDPIVPKPSCPPPAQGKK